MTTHLRNWIALLFFIASTGQAEDLLFQDDFQNRLGEGWSWIREHREGWRVTEQGLEVRVEPGNMWGSANNARNVLVRPAPTNTTGEIEAAVTVENRPTEQYEQVNLVWYYDGGHMVKLGQELVDGQLSIVMGREENDRARTVAILPLKSAVVRLRFLVSANRIHGQFRTPEAETWSEAGECDLPVRGEPKISLHFYQGPARVEHWAKVTEFRLAKRSASEPSTRNDQVQNQGWLLPVRGLHLSVPARRDLPAFLKFIQETLPPEGVNTLIVEFDFQFDFQSRPEFADSSALNKNEVQQIVKACREKGIELIPQINCLGHQSWAEHTGRLLEKHPEFDETPGKYPQNKGIYCRSYCPRHPEVHAVMFDLIDELAKACEAKAFHVGMDEVFILGDPDCPRCKGKSTAELFADEITTLQAHLKQIGCRLWMWGDRFIDGQATKIGKWEASENGTHPAVDLVPKDIVICDWHYDQAPSTPQYFVQKGFAVVACPWRKPPVALGLLDHIRAVRGGTDPAAAKLALGLVQTTWCGFGPFYQAYQAQSAGASPEKNAASESALCFRTLFKAMRDR